MDYMLELATRVLRDRQALKKLKSTDAHAPTWDESLGVEVEKIFGAFGARLWFWHDERCTEMLAEVFYRNPAMAAAILPFLAPEETAHTGKADHDAPACPMFIRLLAQHPDIAKTIAACRFQQEERVLGRWERFKAFFAAKPSPERSAQDIQNQLLSDPWLVKSVARELKSAIPFTMVLDAELDEIELSRSYRLIRDHDAESAKLIAQLHNLQQRAAALEKETGTTPGAVSAAGAS